MVVKVEMASTVTVGAEVMARAGVAIVMVAAGVMMRAKVMMVARAVATWMPHSRRHRRYIRKCSRVHGTCSRAGSSSRICSRSSLHRTLPEPMAAMAQAVVEANVAAVMVVAAKAKVVVAVVMVVVVVAKGMPPSARHSPCSQCRDCRSRTPTRAHHHRNRCPTSSGNYWSNLQAVTRVPAAMVAAPEWEAALCLHRCARPPPHHQSPDRSRRHRLCDHLRRP